MTVLSVNVGLPIEVPWNKRSVATGIFKKPVDGRVMMRTLNLDGDRQADLSVHGGPFKAVYCYPAEHYAFWKHDLARDDLPFGMFGENLTVTGLDEREVQLGDEFTVGNARIVVTQPRMPCYKLGIRFQSADIVKRFLTSGRSGFYVAVMREGDVGTGDAIERVARHPSAVSVVDITRLYVAKRFGPEEVALVKRALTVPSFPDSWKDYFIERIAEAAG